MNRREKRTDFVNNDEGPDVGCERFDGSVLHGQRQQT